MKHSILAIVSLAALAGAAHCDSPAEPGEAGFAASVTPVLKAHCIACHGGNKPKGGFALDTLAPDFAKNAEAWRNVLDRLTEASMPPKERTPPTPAERKAVLDWIAGGLTAHQAQKDATEGRARLRRLNRIEYANTLFDLLGARVDVEALPEDGVAGGFDNVDQALDLSATLLERYLETADAALDAVFVKGPRPEAVKRHIDLLPLAKTMTKTMRPQPRFGAQTLIRDNDIVFLTENQPPKVLRETQIVSGGLYRYRISANAFRHGKSLTFLVYAGTYAQVGVATRLLGAFDVGDEPTVVEFTAMMGPKESIRLAPFGLPRLYAKTADDYAGPGMAVQWVEVEGPIVDVWPPPAAARLFGGVDLARGTLADAKAILGKFLPRAFRRPVGDAEMAPFIQLIKSRLDKGYAFDAALRVGLKAVLCGPDFLFMSANPGKLNDFDLATRLSYFLWSTMPDDALTAVAAAGELGRPERLRAEVERMLKDSRSRGFTENFTGQWLSLRNLKATNPDKKLYPEFDDLLEWSMPRETQLFFEEILRNDRSMLEFVHSDWSMLNERLTLLYGIPGVMGSGFRKVSLPPGSHRGGVMTQASVLKVTANGTITSPVIRGTWVLDRILGTPAPPPPKDVPAIEPDVRGATTIREQLVKHRQIASCATCHSKIDPAGNALENFDVIGGWRDWYRAVPGNGRKQVRIQLPEAKGIHGVARGPDVQASDELADGRKFANIDEFKKLVLDAPDQFARGLARKLLVYGTGHALEFGDRAAVEAIVSDVKTKNYGFRALVHAIVQSPTFRSK